MSVIASAANERSERSTPLLELPRARRSQVELFAASGALIGSTISHYRVLDELGRGGMGVVYRAVDTRLGREVALKFLPDTFADNATALTRFRREARAASALNHPNICTIYDIGEHEGHHFIAMELLRGQSLRDRIETGPISAAEVCRIGAQLAGALEVAHAQGVIHRDVKPGNVFLTERGDAKLLDFGLAKVAVPVESTSTGLTLEAEAELTQEQRVVGTPSYMSPEQVLGRPLDRRTDIFSLGGVLYCMATGRKPFEAATVPGIMDAILRREPEPVQKVNREMPASLARVIERCLVKDLAKRYAGAREVREDLERELSGSGTAVWRGAPAVASRRWLIAALVLMVLVVAGLVIATASSWLPGKDTPRAESAPTPLLAVLPFPNQTGDQGRGHQGEALRAGLLADLGQLTGLRLVAPMSETGADPDDAAAEARRVGAQLLLGGEIQDELGELRVNARIVDASSGVVLWTRVARAESSDLFHPQREIARGVTDFLSIPMSSAERDRLAREGPSSLAAYTSYVEGRRQLMNADGGGLAVELFTQAVAKDPAFALAHAALAEAQWTMYERSKDASRLRAAREAAAQARALDPELPQTILVSLLIDAASGRLATGEQLDRALSRHPRPAEASRLLAASYELAGNVDEAERLLRAATALDPQDWFNWSWLGVFLAEHGAPAKAQPALERAARLAPADVWQPRAYLGATALQLSRFDEAIDLLESLPASVTDAANESNLATAYYYSNRADKWQRAEEHFRAAIELSPGRAEYHGNLADLHAELGHRDQAIESYRRALEMSRAELEANPGDRKARVHAALYAAKAGECPVALEQARKAWIGRPGSSAELHEIALAFAVCRERTEALDVLAAAVERGYPAEMLSQERELEWLRDDAQFPRAGRQ